MKRRIILEQMSFFANHGCFEAERITGNTFTVDLAVDFDFSRAESTDNLADTLDYSRLYALVKEEMQRPANLLEPSVLLMMTKRTGHPLIIAFLSCSQSISP